MNQNLFKDAQHYHKRMIEDAEESKSFIKIDAEIIHNNSNNLELGALVRQMMHDKIKRADEHINYIKNIDNATN